MPLQENCCEETQIAPNLSVKLVGINLYVTYNGKTQIVPLVGLGSGSGSVVEPKPREVVITTDGQTYFSEIIDETETLLLIYVNGQPIFENKGYEIVNRNLTWTGTYPLETTDTLMIQTWQL